MNRTELALLLQQVESGSLTADAALEAVIKKVQLEGKDVRPDGWRALRQGFDEVIYGAGKSVEQIHRIGTLYHERGINFLVTGLDDGKTAQLAALLPHCEALPHAGMMKHILHPAPEKRGRVAVVTAGTSDARVAHEAAETLTVLGVQNDLFIDIGVAGIHRFFAHAEALSQADVLIVIAGMEGALASVAGGQFAQPVIAVPTSVGYGTALNGFTALFAMLTSCASGVTVVNIDNGFGAAMAAFRIVSRLDTRP